MDQSQEFDIINTHRPKIFVTTTGISEREKIIIKKDLPSHIILEDELSTFTTYLISYKSIISDKFVQAMIWNIKFVKIDWLYDTDSNPNKYIMRPLEGMEFTSNDITNDLFINYYCLLGAVYNENLALSTGFFISNKMEGEKYDFCLKNDIPIIKAENIFKNNFKSLQKPFNIKACKVGNQDLFFKKCFYIDPKFKTSLFNSLKRLIIEQKGTRVSLINDEVDYIITNNYQNFEVKKCLVLHYQYIFDCVEYSAELFPNYYIINNEINHTIFKNVVCCIEKNLKRDSQQIVNKLKALGSVLRDDNDISCTHMIIKDKREYKNKGLKPYKVVSVDWIDQCLYTMKHVREDKYLVKESTLSLFAQPFENTPIKRIKAAIITEKIFQFTGLPSFLKNKAIEKLDAHNIKFIVSERYEECTHLIMGNLSTSEKFLSALCNGAWILTPQFIDDYDNSLHFDFEKYEWKADENTEVKDAKIIESIQKWRERVNKTGYPAFYKWKVKIYADDAKKASFTRVINNGGGEVTDSENITHVFVAKNFTGEIIEKKRYSTDYIFSYLFR